MSVHFNNRLMSLADVKATAMPKKSVIYKEAYQDAYEPKY